MVDSLYFAGFEGHSSEIYFAFDGSSLAAIAIDSSDFYSSDATSVYDKWCKEAERRFGPANDCEDDNMYQENDDIEAYIETDFDSYVWAEIYNLD